MAKDELIFLIQRYGYARRNGAHQGKKSAEWMREIETALEATGPERDLAEQVLAALETLAIVGACGRFYLSDEGEPLDMCSVTCDVLKGKYRYWFADTNQAARDEDGSLVTRAEALERLRLMATDVGHWNAVAADTARRQLEGGYCNGAG